MKKMINGTPVQSDNDGDEGGFHPDFQEMNIRKAGNGVVINTRKKSPPAKKGSLSGPYDPGTDSVHTSAKSALGHVMKHMKK